MTFINRKGRGRWAVGLGLIVGSLLLASGTAFSQEHGHFDVLLYQDGSGNIGAGGIEVDELEAHLDDVVFEGELLGDSTAGTPSYTADEPGYYSPSDANAGIIGGGNDNLPGSSAITLDFLVEPTLNISLAYWDDGLGQFGATPSGEQLTIASGAVSGTIGGVSGTEQVLGLAIGSTSGTGFFDDHPDFGLLGGQTEGVYLAYGEASASGTTGTAAFWLVFGTIDECEETASCTPAQDAFNASIEAQIEAGIDYVNLVLVPEPGTALLFGLGLMGLGRAGRERR